MLFSPCGRRHSRSRRARGRRESPWRIGCRASPCGPVSSPRLSRRGSCCASGCSRPSSACWRQTRRSSVWWTTKARAYYATGLLCEVVVLLLVLRLRERASRRDAALLGFTLGFAVWATLQSMLLSLPALAWLVWRRPRVLRLVWIAVPGFVLGAFPWLAWNAVNDWKALVPDAVAGEDTTYAERFTDLFTTV